MRLSNLIPFNTEFFVWDAVVSWRDHIFKTDFYNCSKGSYLTNMLKLIESNIVNVQLQLKHVNESWLSECRNKIDNNRDWAKSTKTVRKSCLNMFYTFIKEKFDCSQIPYQRHPDGNEIQYILSLNVEEKEKHEALEKAIKHALSNVADKVRVRYMCPIILCNAVRKINERDAYIVWLMMHTGQPLEAILDLKKTKDDYEPPYIRFKGSGKHTPEHITNAIDDICKNSTVYLFETAKGKRITRAQITRNLKLAGRNIGLDFDLTPKILHGYVCAYMSKEKRSEIEKSLSLET